MISAAAVLAFSETQNQEKTDGLLLSTGETAGPASPSDRSKKSLPKGAYAVKDEYIWDSWIVGVPSVEAASEHEKTNDPPKPKLLFRYALTAPKKDCGNDSNKRHDLAKVRCATSVDDGENWVDHGVVLKPRQDEEWPNLAIWTSQTMILNGNWVMWVTGRNQGDQKDVMNKDLMDSQKIGRVTSKDGIEWDPSKIDVVLHGKDDTEAKKMGYDVTNDDNVPAAFRDPMVFDSDGKLHMVFAAKHRMVEDGKEYLLPTVGYATSKDEDGKPGTWKIQSPIVLPHYDRSKLENYNIDEFKKNKHQTPSDDTVRQIEVPYVVQRKDAKGKEHTYLFVSTQSNPNGKTNRDKKAAFRGYVSENGMKGPFKALYGHVEEPEFKGEPDKIYEHALYAPTVTELPQNDGKVKYVASTFYSEDTFWPLTGTPLFPVTWDDRHSPPVPKFHFPDPKDILIQQWLWDQMIPLDINDANALIDTLVEEMKRGLNGEKTSLGMFPAYVSAEGAEAVPGNRTVAVIDAGGTNLRIGLAKSDNEGKVTLDIGEPQPMPGQNKEEAITAKDFHDVLRKKLESEPMKGKFEEIGFCFSYPTIITDDHDGILERWTKEINISGMVDKKIGIMLKETLKSPNMKVVVLNDTVATLLTGVMWAKEEGLQASSYVGFILGTGTNTAYVEKNCNIGKVQGEQGSQIINVESGGFAKFLRGPPDEQIDEHSKNGGQNFLEKATSGEYLGILTLHLFKEPVIAALLSEEAKRNLGSLKEKLKTKHISNLCKDNEEDDTGELKDDTGELERTSFTDDDIAIMKTVFGAVVERAALLCAVTITAAVLKSGAGTDKDQPVIVCIDGSTYYKTFLMQEKVEMYLKNLLQAHKLHCRCVHVEDAPAIGAAIAGLTTFQKTKD